VNVWVAIVAVLVLAGCGSDKKATSDDMRVERCVKLMSGGDSGLRTYVETAYCKPFAARGWVHDDGTLSIKAQIEGVSSSCVEASGTPGGQTTTLPCKPDAAMSPLDCGLLRFVQREEVQAYIRDLQRSHKVTCDDGTPLNDLGAG
jgi:hypothetical protein